MPRVNYNGRLTQINANRMGGRVDEGGSLENCCTLAGTPGSNPGPSAFLLNLNSKVITYDVCSGTGAQRPE